MSQIPLDQYCTKPFAGCSLVASMGRVKPGKVVELGAGFGALSSAAAQSWGNFELVTVDNDHGVEAELKRQFLGSLSVKHRHFSTDALAIDLPRTLFAGHAKADAAICNPPYNTRQWSTEYEGILAEVKFPQKQVNVPELGLSPVFLAQNLRLVRNSGVIGTIVPDWIATGRSAFHFRKWLMEEHALSRVVQLPRGAFHRTDAQAFAMVLSKDAGRAERLEMVRCGTDGQISASVEFSGSPGDRLDYDYHLMLEGKGHNVFSATLADMGVSIQRGRLTSSQAREAKFAVLHTTDLPRDQSEIILPTNNHLPPDQIVGEKNDILIARVDRNLHEKVAFVRAGSAVLTDCVFRLRAPNADREKIFEFFRSLKGQHRLKAISRGVAAKMISKAELMRMPLE